MEEEGGVKWTSERGIEGEEVEGAWNGGFHRGRVREKGVNSSHEVIST